MLLIISGKTLKLISNQQKEPKRRFSIQTRFTFCLVSCNTTESTLSSCPSTRTSNKELKLNYSNCHINGGLPLENEYVRKHKPSANVNRHLCPAMQEEQ